MSFFLLIACLRPPVEVTTPPPVQAAAEAGTEAPAEAPAEALAEAPEASAEPPALSAPRTPPEQYKEVLCPDGRYAVGGWVSGLNQSDIAIGDALTVPMRTDFCAPAPDTECTLAPQTFTPGGYTGMEDLVTLVQVPAGRVNIHWVGEGGCLLWQDGHAVLNVDDCPQNPDEVSFESDVALLPATCTDGRQGWFSDNDLLDSGATQEE